MPEEISYELEKDITGDVPKPIYIIGPNGDKFEVPHLPKPSCKKCYGRGWEGIDKKRNFLVMCSKCYRRKV